MLKAKPIRIAVVCGFPPDPQGESHYSGVVFSQLASRYPDNAEIRVFAHRNTNNDTGVSSFPNLSVERITDGPSRWERTKQVYKLFFRIREFKPDLVHFQGTHTSLYGGLFGEPATLLMATLRFMGIPTILTLHSTWMPSDLNELWANKKLSPIATWLANKYTTFHLRAMCRAATIFRVLIAGDSSPCTEEYLKGHGLNPRKLVEESHPCSLLPVTNAAMREAKERLGLSGKTILFANGFVRPDKGYHLLLEAAIPLFKTYPDLVVVIAGQPQGIDGARYAEQMREMVANCSDKDRIHLEFRYLSDGEMASYFDSADVIVIPYARAIGASGPIHHAIGRGKPVIATAVGHNRGLKSVIQLFTPPDGCGLRDAICTLIASSSEMSRLQSISIEYAQKNTWDKLADEYFNEYQQVTRLNHADVN